MNQSSKCKPVKAVLSALWWTVTALLIVILAVIMSAKLQGKVPQIFGYSVMRIATGSMEPDLMVGDYILVRECDPDDVKKGDIISFYSKDPAIYGLPNTHSVAEEPTVTDSGIEFVTRGVANVKNDDYRVSEDMLIGKYVATLGFLSGFSAFSGGNFMFVLIMILQAALLFVVALSIFKKTPDDAVENISPEEEKRIKEEAIREYLDAHQSKNK